VQHVEVLAELDNIARVLERAGALAAIEIGNMRGAADAGKSDVVEPYRVNSLGADSSAPAIKAGSILTSCDVLSTLAPACLK
jgi:hypothetical protein